MHNKYQIYRFKKVISQLLFILIISNFSLIVTAQTEDTLKGSIINQQIWIDFYPHYYVNNKLEYYGDAGYRTIIGERSWERLYARPSLKYHLNSTWEMHAGIGFFYIFNKIETDNFEITPWQGLQVNWPKLTRFKFKHLFKLEERLSFKTDDWNSNFEFRFRYKLFGNLNFVRNKRIYIPFYGEFFLPLQGNVEEFYKNKGRAGVGLGYKLNKKWQFAFIFNWQGSRAGINENINVSDYAYQIKIKKVWSNILFK